MSASRKLQVCTRTSIPAQSHRAHTADPPPPPQGEIDRTLKKVQEGVEVFDDIWEKVYGAQNQNQKEKFESELKSQIKKLQRYRDDIKTWITNSDIKDKRPLTDARKLIETEMERFKVCEKEFKTKAFSKEGLSQAPKEDPKEKEKNRVRKWIAGCIEIITSQVNVYEAELETINTTKKKSKKDAGIQRWEDLLDRCRFHEQKLEGVLRLIDNETLSPEDVDQIKDQLDYLLEQMVEGNTEEVHAHRTHVLAMGGYDITRTALPITTKAVAVHPFRIPQPTPPRGSSTAAAATTTTTTSATPG